MEVDKMIKIDHKNKHLDELLSIDTSSVYFNCVLDGSMKGQVWVDNLEKPTFAVVWNEYQKGFQLMGKPVEKSEYKNLRLFFETVIFKFLKEKDIGCFECGSDSEELTKMLFEIFQDKNIESEQQKYFGLNQIICPNENGNIINNELEITAIDDAFLLREFTNKEYVMNEIIGSWTSKEAYLKKGYGYAAVIGNCIVSRALVTCSYHQQDNIGVDTLEEFRKKGISSKLVYLTLLEAKKRDRKSIWDCTENNVASERTALKVGFELERTETICWFDIA
jgi:predicted acetyltransferase